MRSTARTLTRTGPVPITRVGLRLLLLPQQTIESLETRLQFKIDRLLGEGGFGQVYLAVRLGRSSSPEDPLHQGEHPDRRLAAGGVLRSALRRAPAGDPDL